MNHAAIQKMQMQYNSSSLSAFPCNNHHRHLTYIHTIINRLTIQFTLITLFIIALHSIPTGSDTALNRMEWMTFRLDHLIHMTMFLPWMAIAWFYVYRSRENLLRRSLICITAGLLLAAGAEALQYWIPYRSFNFTDMFFNMLGVLAGSVLFFFDPYTLPGMREKTRDKKVEEVVS